MSGLSLSKVSASMLIKEFCGGKAGWNDGAVFIKTDLVVLVQFSELLINRSSSTMMKSGDDVTVSSL